CRHATQCSPISTSISTTPRLTPGRRGMFGQPMTACRSTLCVARFSAPDKDLQREGALQLEELAEFGRSESSIIYLMRIADVFCVAAGISSRSPLRKACRENQLTADALG